MRQRRERERRKNVEGCINVDTFCGRFADASRPLVSTLILMKRSVKVLEDSCVPCRLVDSLN